VDLKEAVKTDADSFIFYHVIATRHIVFWIRE